MPRLPFASPPQFPLGWEGEELGWIATSGWLSATFPNFGRRHAAFLERVRVCFDADSDALRDSAVALLDEVLTSPASSTTDAIVALHDRMHLMPPSSSRGIAALHLVIATLAGLQRSDGESPIAAAVRCCGWITIPPDLAELAVDLAISLPRRYDSEMLGFTSGPVAPTDDLDDRDLSAFDREVESYLERPGEGFRREAGSDEDDEPPVDTMERRVVRHLARVAAALAEATGSTAPLWSPITELADWLAQRGTRSYCALGTVTRRPDYFLRVMPLVDHLDPRTLPLYEAYADSCDRTHWEHVERAALALANATSTRAAATTLLRAATRRFFTGDLPGCRALAEQAFAALQAADDREGAWFAAGLVARTSAIDDPLAARAWLTTAQALTPEHNEVARLGIAVELVAACEATGDELGRRRATAEVDRLRTSVQPERVSDLVDECSRPAEADVARDYGGFGRTAELLAELEFAGAHSAFSETLGELVETRTIDDVVAQLRDALAIVDSSGPTSSATWRKWGGPTIAGWLCAAIAELLVDPARDDEWEVVRRRQFAIEDDAWALPEELIDGDGLERLKALLDAEGPERLIRRLAQAFLAEFRLARCAAEAEEALAEGRARRARVWTERAAELRRRT